VIGNRGADLRRLGVVDVLGQEHLRERQLPGERAFPGDLPLAIRRVRRQDRCAGMLRHSVVVRETRVDEREELGHRGHDIGVVDALLGGEHDAARLSAGTERGEVLLQDGEAIGTVGVRNVERLLVGRADGTDGDEDADECGQPQADRTETVVEAPGAEAAKRCRTAARGPCWGRDGSGMVVLKHVGSVSGPRCVPVARQLSPGWVLSRTGLSDRSGRVWQGDGSREDSEMQIRLLGGVRAFSDADESIDIGPAKCQAVVASLALTPGSAVPVSRLVAMVWGDEPPRTAERTLQSYITRLRKELGDASIVRAGAAYRLNVDPESIDVIRFQRLVAEGDATAALEVWGGAPFAGLDADGLGPAAQHLVEQWLAATETHLAERVEAEPAAVIGRLTELVAEHPFREALSALLMLALYRVGRQADALAAYRATRHRLVEELGVEPGPELQALEARILAQDSSLGTATARPRPANSSATVTFGFVDVDDVTRAWVDHPHESAAASARLDQLVRSAAHIDDGRVFSERNSSFGVAFARPADAAAWATALQSAVGREPWPRGVTVRIRIGLHTGDAAAQSGTYFGPAVNLASCLAGAAQPGQSLLTAATAALLDGATVVRDLGTFAIDGVPSEQRILQLGGGVHPPVRSTDDRRGNLPRRSIRLIGRDAELRRIGDAIATDTLVTLVGPGGIGKTSLAITAAVAAEADFDGGGWLIELASVAQSSDVPRAVAEALGVRESPGRDLLDAVIAALRQRRALVVLDNCEHVIDGAAHFANAVIAHCPNVHVVATSRERLALAGERVVAVGPLEPSVFGAELFRDRAAALDPAFDTHANRPDIEEICRRLDGLPLAIELAAARSRTMPPADLLARLDDGLRLLTGGGRSGVEHHRTLRATIEWSYDLLAASEQTVFRRLAAFVGPFDLAAAETVAADGAIDAIDVADCVARLVDQSMVVVESGPFGRRFKLLESMRQFAIEQSRATGDDSDDIGRRHAVWCLGTVDRIGAQLAGRDEIEGVARLHELWPNLRTALEWACAAGDTALARSLVAPVAAEVLIRSQTEIGEWAERILAIAPADDIDLVTFALSLAARRFWRTQDRDGFERLVQRYGAPDHPLTHHARALVYQDAAALVEWCPQVGVCLRASGDDHLAELADIGLPRALLTIGRFAVADQVMAVLLDRYRRNGPPSLLSWILTMCGYSALAQGDHERADRLFDESAATEVAHGTHSRNKPNEAMAALRRDDRTRALMILRSDVDDLLDNDDVYDMAGTAIAFMSIMAKLGRFAEAARIEGHLEAARHLKIGILYTIVLEATDLIAAAGTDEVAAARELGRSLQGHDALLFMHAVLADEVSGR
jgi:predicted ATPase/DNA-binding SARP family transcriptional activator